MMVVFGTINCIAQSSEHHPRGRLVTALCLAANVSGVLQSRASQHMQKPPGEAAFHLSRPMRKCHAAKGNPLSLIT